MAPIDLLRDDKKRELLFFEQAYNELLVLSNKRVSDLHTLNDFMKNSHEELTWLNEKEVKELARDWADRNLSAQEVRQS